MAQLRRQHQPGRRDLACIRATRHLKAFLEPGAAHDGVSLRLPIGPQIVELPTPRVAVRDVPSGGAIIRPVLGRLLADATRAAGTTVRLGRTLTSIEQDAEGVEVSFTDGQRRRYDLLIGCIRHCARLFFSTRLSRAIPARPVGAPWCRAHRRSVRSRCGSARTSSRASIRCRRLRCTSSSSSRDRSTSTSIRQRARLRCRSGRWRADRVGLREPAAGPDGSAAGAAPAGAQCAAVRAGRASGCWRRR